MHEALLMMWCFFLSYRCSFTPFTMVMSGFLHGAETITFFAPAVRCCDAPSLSVKKPVLSMTTSMFSCFHGNFVGSFSVSTLIVLPLIIKESCVCSIVPWNLPKTESYLSRCAKVCVSVRSLIATHSMFLLSMPAWRTCRPILPKPLMATLIAIEPFAVNGLHGFAGYCLNGDADSHGNIRELLL